jgi:ABC-type multidrug transport system ATPase subunit
MNPVVVHDLAKRFGDTTALDGISFDVNDAELFGFIGPDGAGKTTLFRILTTLILPDAGTAHVLGLDVVRDLWAIRSRVGYMPGRFSLYPDLSVREILEFFASVFGSTVEDAADVIAPIWRQIEPFRDRRAAALSGGMKQKLALCCALVHRPDILLLDEPTTGVDAVSRREFWDLLAQLKASGLTVVVSTPYMDEASRCDRVALVQHGKILEIAAPGVIGARYPRPLLSVRAARRHELLQALRQFPHAYSAFPFGADVHYADARTAATPGAIAGELTTWLVSRGFPDAHAEPIPAGVEDVFMALMGTPDETVAA